MLCRRVVVVALELVLLTNARAAACGLHKSKPLLIPHYAFFMKSFSSKRIISDEQSFTVSYLISSCGLSPETAVVASQTVNFRSADQPDSVLTLLRNHGLTNTHISKLARNRPRLLLCDPKHTLLPKLEFFQSMGVPNSDLGMILSKYPTLLGCSLNNQLIPVYNYLKTVFLLDDKQVRRTLKNSPRFFTINLERTVVPKIAALIELGVPASSLSLLVTHFPSALLQNCERFDKTVKEVVEMGINPWKTTFVCVLDMMFGLSKLTWEHKREVYKKCGWSEDDFQLALKKHPLCMRLSVKKITSTMDFLVNKMGWKPVAIAKVPLVLGYSLERRTIPRCSVIKVLMLKGLVEKDVCVSSVVTMNNKYFLDRFVTKYAEDVPQLLDVFNGKVGFDELGFESEKR